MIKKVEFHTHTKYSYDSVTSLHDVIKSCLKRGINYLAVTDHNQIEGALRLQKMAPFNVIVGEEILTKEGEIIGLFLKKRILPGLSLQETIIEIRNQGGIVYLPHPYDKTTRRTSIKSYLINKTMGNVDLVEIYNGRSVLPWNNLSAKKLSEQYSKIPIIGSDSHTRHEYGRNYIEMPEFKNKNEFINNLGKARFKTAPVLYWVFILTKWARFLNRRGISKGKINLIAGKGNCIICGGGKFKLVYKEKGIKSSSYLITDNSYGDHFQIVECVNCKLIFAYPVDNSNKILKKYQSFEDSEYEAEREARKQSQLKILKRLNKFFPKKGTILEVGCATGVFLQSAKEDGWNTLGIEPSYWAANIAKKKYKLPVLIGSFDTVDLKEKVFDVVIALDVIEHLSNPRKFISWANKILKKDGVLCLVTPDYKSLASKILGEKWWHIRPDHIFYFSYDTLSTLLFSERFTILRKESYSWRFSFDYLASRFKNNIPIIYVLTLLLKKIPFINYLTKRNYTINFRDSLELYCKRIQK